MPLPIYKANKAKTLSNQVKVVAIAAGKGGVGKSTVTVNLALALNSLGLRVGIFDADIYGPSQRRMLREETPPSQREGYLIPAICHGGIRMMTMAYFRNEQEAAAVRAPIANGIIMQFIEKTLWGDLDYLLIDFPPGTGDIQLTLAQRASLTAAVMVTTPQEVALMDVAKAMDLFTKVQVPIAGIIENMSYYCSDQAKEPAYIFGKGGGKRLASEKNVPFIAELPIDAEICHCCDIGKPLIDINSSSKSEAAHAFVTAAKGLINQMDLIKDKSNDNMQNFTLKWKELPKDASHSH